MIAAVSASEDATSVPAATSDSPLFSAAYRLR
jgi:hypothetical protein